MELVRERAGWNSGQLKGTKDTRVKRYIIMKVKGKGDVKDIH